MKSVFYVIGLSHPSSGENKKLDSHDSSAHAVKMSFAHTHNEQRSYKRKRTRKTQMHTFTNYASFTQLV